MLDREQWNLVQQTIMANRYDLTTPFQLKEKGNQNISLALQFYKKRDKQTLTEMNSAVAKRTAEINDGIDTVDTSAGTDYYSTDTSS